MKYSLVVPIFFDGHLAPALCAEVELVMAEYLHEAGFKMSLS